MKKNLFLMWLMLLAILFSVNMEAQMTIGGKKEPEPFSVLELLNKGGLRLPQMTTAERNAFAVKNNVKGEGLTIYNIDTKCVEYWNKVRWVSLCEGTSQTTISPQPCIDVAADATGCDNTFNITDPDCPNGPFNIAIVAGADYATLNDVDNANGSFKIAFNQNETINIHTVLVRVTSTCTSLYKEFLFSQNGVDCTAMPYTVPSVSPATPSLTLCTGGAVYLSVPANTANLDKLIWTRNGIEIPNTRGVNNIIVTQKGKYNISMGAIGCNTNTANERTVTESGTVAPIAITALASNNGVICGTNPVILTASGTIGTIAWFHNGVEEKSGTTVSISGDSSVGQWFAAVKDGSCYSKPSNTLTITKSETASGQVTVSNADVLVNGVALNTFTAFCAGGSLDLSVNNKQNGITYTWYNGNDIITTNPFTVPASQTSMSLRMVATDNSGAKCPAEANVIEKAVVSGSTPAQPNITGTATLCDGTTDLTLVPAATGTYTYTWYKDGVKMTENTATITVTTPGVTYSGTVTNPTGCTSIPASKPISPNVSSLPVLSWVVNPDTANFGAKITLQTAIKFGPADTYTWTTDNSQAIITGTSETVTVQLPTSGTDGTMIKITVVAKNSCGNSVPLEYSIKVNNACPTPSLTAQSALILNTVSGKSVELKVTPLNSVLPTYQWYSTSTAVATGGTAISGATTATYNYTAPGLGTTYLYCKITNGCTGSPTAVSPSFTVNTTINPADIPTGQGTLTGKTCFDIAEGNDNTTCGMVAGRLSMKSDFNLTATNKQTYTFTPVGTVSKLRFMYVESLSGKIVQSLTADVDKSQALNVSGVQTATLVYKTTLSSSGGTQGDAYGKNNVNPLTVDIYAVYNDAASGGGTDRQVKLTATIKDCMCCGAYLAPGVWREIMCYNLGADQSLDPFTPSPGIRGDNYYQGTKSPAATARIANGWDNTGTGKSDNDPCPPGYHVPSISEWQGMANANYNVQKWLGGPLYVDANFNWTGGVQIGTSLMLPGNFNDNRSPIAAWTALDSIVGFVRQPYSGAYIVTWGTQFSYAPAPYLKTAVRCFSMK